MAHSYIDKFGYRRQRANPISRVGVFPYTGEQIDQPKKDPITGKKIEKKNPLTGETIYKKDPKTGAYVRDEENKLVPEYEMQLGLEPNRLYPVLRGPDALFDQEAIESFNGLPIKVGHLMLGDKTKNKEDKDKRLSSVDENPIDGCIYNVRPSLDEPGYLIAEFCIYTDRMKDILAAGKIRELSLGYTCVYEKEDGVFEGVPYMFRQTKLRGNHLALVKRGRCGSSVCVCDEAVITFDSLPEGQSDLNPEGLEGQTVGNGGEETQKAALDSNTNNPKRETQMEEKNKEDTTEKLERAKALAAAIKGGDEQLAQDCLDFADFPPEVRKEALEHCKAGKCEKKDDDKEVADKAAKTAKDGDDVPPPPPATQEPEKKVDEAPATASAAASAPVQGDNPEPPPAEVPSPKDGESPVEGKDCKDKAPEAHVCDKCGKDPCECAKVEEKKTEDKATKDNNAGVTEPTAQVPVAALEGEKKEEVKVEEKPVVATDKAPAEVTLTDKSAETVKKDTEPGQNAETATLVVKSEMIKSVEPKVEQPKTAQDEYASFVAEYTATQALAAKLRPYIKETFDSAPMRMIDVARFAAKHIENLAFVMDEADDEKVLTAVRGYAAAVAMDAAPKKEEVFEDNIKSVEVITQDEAPAVKPTTSSKDLLDFLSK